MKKFLVLFVGLAILAGSVCALDLPDALKIPGLVVTGTVRAGFRVSGGTVSDHDERGVDGDVVDPVAYAYSDDPNNGAPFRAQLQLVWTRGNLGVKTRFRYQPGGESAALGSTTPFNVQSFINKAFVWGDVLDKKVRLTVGKEQDAAWGVFWSNLSGSDTDQYDGKDGAKIELKPIDGLNLGLFYGANGLFTGAYRTTNENGEGIPAVTSGLTPLLVAGAKYSTDTFGVTASLLHQFNFADTTSYGLGIQDLSGALPNTSNLLVGIKLSPSALPLTVNANLGLGNLGAKTEKKLNANDDVEGNETEGWYNDGDYNPYTFFYAKLNAEYGVNDAVAAGITISDIQVGSGYYYAVSDAGESTDRGEGQFFPITLSPYVNYAINDNVEVGGELSFKINKGGSDQFGFGVTPSATFQLGSGASFNVYDELIFYTGSKYIVDADDADYRNAHRGLGQIKPNREYAVLQNGGAPGTENTFHIEFSWSF
jgi:hypothetical protein